MFNAESQSFDYQLGENSFYNTELFAPVPSNDSNLSNKNVNLTNVQTIAFVDYDVAEVDNLTENIQADVKVILEPNRDGIEQIGEILGQYDNITGVHIISHGNTAELQLGNSIIDATSLEDYTEELQQWKSSLSSAADINLYGCKVAQGEEGQAFIDDLSYLTDADVAASIDLTGNENLGGDWLLEYSTGDIETEIPFSDSFTDEYGGILATLFEPTDVPTTDTDFSDGTGSAGDYELGMEFETATDGQIDAIRYWKAPSESGTHQGRIWDESGNLLASVTFSNESTSGWQEQALTTPLNIEADSTYVVSVNVNTHYGFTRNELGTTITNGNLSAIADGSNGVYNTTPGNFPTQSFQNSNYFRDIVFATTPPNPDNNPGEITLSGSETEDETLTATVSDPDGISGANINYQWQQSDDGGATWNNIVGAVNQTLTLDDARVGRIVRASASYSDDLGSNETVTSTGTGTIANLNDEGTVSLAGQAAIGSTLNAQVADPDGLEGVTISYQWQRSDNDGATWIDLAGENNQNLSLDNSLEGQRVRVNAIYTDEFGGSENIFSAATSSISATAPTQTLFEPTDTPERPNFTDNLEDWELGMQFTTATNGQIQAIRYYKSPSETGTHIGKIWSSTGELLTSVTFDNETASGWQEQTLETPLTVLASQTYIVSVNANDYYSSTPGGFDNPISNDDISTPVGAGIYNETIGVFPNTTFNNENYYRDIVFSPTAANPDNIPGVLSISGTAQEDETLTVTVNDPDGINGVTIDYQWQQSDDDGATWNNIVGANNQTLTLGDAQVNNLVRVRATYIDELGSIENPIATPTSAIANVNDLGLAFLAGSATVGANLKANIFDTEGLTLSNINYQWQELVNNVWTNISGATANTLSLTTTLLGQQVRVLANYIDNLGSNENISSSEVSIASQNAIELENQKPGTRDWEITDIASNNEILGYGDATSINKGEALNLKISLAQSGQYDLDVYRLGYYDGAGGRLVASVSGLNGFTQADPTITNFDTNLVEYDWNTSYTLQTGADWTTGLYFVKLTDSQTGKENYIQFVLRDDDRPADIGFQDAITTAAAYNNVGGYSVYDFNSDGGQRAYQVSFDRPFSYDTSAASEQFNNTLTWEYNMTRWLESQGYDVSYYSNLDVHANPLQLYSQNVFLSVGHDEYWSMAMRDNVEQARDSGINLAFFSANTAYWQVRFDSSSSGESNRVMTVYKDSTGVGTGSSIDPIAETNPAAATTLFRSAEVNRPENSLIGVGYTGDIGSQGIYDGFDFVVTNASDPYYANTGLQNGDRLSRLVGYEWDSVLNNSSTPAGLVVLSQSSVPSSGLIQAGIVPPGTDDTVSNAVRYTAPSGAKVFSTGSVQWVWGLDSDRVINPRTDVRAQQIAINVFKDMGAIPLTPSSGLVV